LIRADPRLPAAAVLAGAVVALSLGPLPARAQPLEKLTVERIHALPPLGGSLPKDLAWTPDAKRVTWLRGDGPGADLWALEAATGRASVLVEGTRLLTPAPPGTSARPLPLEGYVWSPTGEALLVAQFGDIFVVDVRRMGVRALVRTAEEEELPAFSPDGRLVAFVRRNDLYVVDVASGRETRLTRSGSDTVLNGRLDWVYEEELASRSPRAFAWSPDSRKIAYLQLDQARVPTFPIVDFLPVHNTTAFQRYPKAGDPNSIVRIGVLGLGRDEAPGPERLLSFTPDDLYVLPDLAWSSDSKAVVFQQLNREQNELLLRSLAVPEDPRALLGDPRTILVERSDTWVNASAPPRFLKDARRFVWVSEKSGFAHLHLCDLAGACRPVTQGPWVVDAQASFATPAGLLFVDERTGFVYFTGTEKDPRERHLYRTRLDGTGRARLTREDGTHKVLLSPDARFYVDTFSDALTPPKVFLSSVDGLRRWPIEDNASPEVLKYERGQLEWVDLLAKDGTVLHASLLKPRDFDPRRRYPVLVSVYGGPHAQVVRNEWGHTSDFEHLLASRGFLVFSLDNRGSAYRGHAFEAPIFRDMGRVELEDQLLGVAYLASLPFVDPARIGIWGWSYGGYMTLYALTRAPRTFKAGVAGAPVTDWKLYDSIYTERYMGTPRSNPSGYETSSPLAKAAALEAELLIVHGTADDNVHVANTVAFADALVKAGRPHALNLHPGEKHGFSAKESKIARDRAILRHFETHLLGPKAQAAAAR
jgi:dipeptidyl-peptidase-4